jgi:alpha-tubulin suppressor-like RCC1 family protein
LFNSKILFYFVLEEGNIYTFGCNSESQLGLGRDATDSFYNFPQKISEIESQPWQTLSAGAGQSCALSSFKHFLNFLLI